MIFTRLKNHLIGWRTWELNPIVIKELRQAVRSWAVTGMLLLFLVVLFITSLVVLVNQSLSVNEDAELGRQMFQVFTVILAGASILFIPLYLGTRVGAERMESNHDLLYVSTLSPGRIIRGKFFCGAYLALLFFSACLPFMAFTNLLRGIDLPSVFFILAVLFLAVCALNQVAIFLACLPLNRAFKVLLALAGVFCSFWVIAGLVAFSLEMTRSGIGSMMGRREFWAGFGTVVGIGLALTGLLHVLAVALISPASANRAWLPRLYITIIWLLGAGLNVAWAIQIKEPRVIFVWTYVSLAMLALALLVTIANTDHLGPRIRRSVPKSVGKRLLAFPFFNGAAGGLLWVAGLAGLTVLFTELMLRHSHAWFPGRTYLSANEQQKVTLFNLSTVFYVFAYGLTGLFLHRKFLSKRPAKIAPVMTVLLIALWALAPGLLKFFQNKLSWKSLEGLQLGNIFNIFTLEDAGQWLAHLYFALGWLVLMLLLSGPWFWRQWQNFQPLPEAAPPPLKPEEPVTEA
jgi:hypothetical protein